MRSSDVRQRAINSNNNSAKEVGGCYKEAIAPIYEIRPSNNSPADSPFSILIVIYILSFSSQPRRNSCHPWPNKLRLQLHPWMLHQFSMSETCQDDDTALCSPTKQVRIRSYRFRCFVSTFDVFPPLKSHSLRRRQGTHTYRPNCTVVHAACPIFAAPNDRPPKVC